MARQHNSLNIFDFQAKVTKKFHEEETLAQIDFGIEKFNKIWNRWRPLFR